jgi:cell division protein FtsA
MSVLKSRETVLAALDIGTSKVAALVAKRSPGGQLELLGAGVVKSEGVRTGAVNNITQASSCIREALKEAEQTGGVRIRTVAAGIAGSEMVGRQVEVELLLGEKSREITVRDLARLSEKIEGSNISTDEILLHVEPQEYVIDGRTSTADPVGMWGNRLQLEALVITASVSAVNNIRRCIRLGGAEVGELILEPLASAEAVLDDDERLLGTGLLDLGGGTSDLALFQRGAIRTSFVIPLGGDLVTRDLAMVLRAPLQASEELKKNVGLTGQSDQQPELLHVGGVGEAEGKDVPGSLVSEIIKARMEEILGFAAKVFAERSFREPLAGGVVLTGGTSKMKGLEDLASKLLRMPVRCGRTNGITGDDDIVRSPAHSTGVGLLLRVAQMSSGDGRQKRHHDRLWHLIKEGWKALG